MEFSEYLLEVAKEKELHPEWRMGQTYFNVLRDVKPDLADEVSGSDHVDPFYQDNLIGGFLNYVCYNWESVARDV